MWKSILGKSTPPPTLSLTTNITCATRISLGLTSFADPSRTDSEKFKVSLIEDVAGVSLCGALKSESCPS